MPPRLKLLGLCMNGLEVVGGSDEDEQGREDLRRRARRSLQALSAAHNRIHDVRGLHLVRHSCGAGLEERAKGRPLLVSSAIVEGEREEGRAQLHRRTGRRVSHLTLPSAPRSVCLPACSCSLAFWC